jgi:hypothetical protein
VAYEDLVAVLLLLGVCPVDVVPEGGLNPGSIFIILLKAEQGIVSVGADKAEVDRASPVPNEVRGGGIFTTASGFQ